MRKVGKRKPRRARTFLIVCLLAAIVGGVYFYITLHTVKDEKVVVTGNVHYTDEQIKDMVMVDALSHNSLYLSFAYKDKQIKDVPFIASMSVKVTAPDAIHIQVFEKKLAGYLVFLGENVYFDDDGTVMEISNTYTEGVPEITGVIVEEVLLNEVLPVDNPAIFELILEITKSLEKHDIIAQKIHFDDTWNITLYIGDLKVEMGQRDYLNEKFDDLRGMLDSGALDGKKGTLDLKNDDGSDNFNAILTPDV